MYLTLFRRLGLPMALLIISGGGYSNANSQPLQIPPGAASDSSTALWAYDQVEATPSLKQAPTASVALAQINIALYKAKQATEKTLCGGQWTPLGTLLQLHDSPKYGNIGYTDKHKTAWHFNVFRRPNNLSCGSVSRTRFFMEMSRNLPEWIQIRPAGQLTAFRNGDPAMMEQLSVALDGSTGSH